MQLARRVQRLIVGLDRQVEALTRWQSRASAAGTVAAAGAVAADVHLTPRELSVLALVADGLTAAATARRLLVAERTVHKHLERIYAKFGVSDRVSAVLRAQRLGLCPSPYWPSRADRSPLSGATRPAGLCARRVARRSRQRGFGGELILRKVEVDRGVLRSLVSR